MACALNSSVGVRRALFLALAVVLAGCRGEPVPRDYQNAPPAMTHPPQKKSETPAAQGMPGPAPQPSTGVEGSGSPYKPVTPPAAPTTTIKDTPPANTTS